MKIKKIKATITIVICIWVVAFLQIMSNQIFMPKGDITQVLAQTKFTLTKGTIEVRGKINQNCFEQLNHKEKELANLGYKTQLVSKESDKKVYVHFVIESTHQIDQMMQLKEELEKLTNIRVSLTVDGIMPGTLTDDEKKQVVKDIFLRLGANEVMSKSKDYYLAYGYAQGISDFIRINGERVNISVAVTENETEGLTDMLISTPLLNEDF